MILSSDSFNIDNIQQLRNRWKLLGLMTRWEIIDIQHNIIVLHRKGGFSYLLILDSNRYDDFTHTMSCLNHIIHELIFDIDVDNGYYLSNSCDSYICDTVVKFTSSSVRLNYIIQRLHKELLDEQ